MNRVLAILIAIVLLMSFASPVFAADDGDYDDIMSIIRKYIASWFAWLFDRQDGKPDAPDVTKPTK